MWRLMFHGHVELNLTMTQRHYLRLTIVISFTNLTASAPYNHACYNIEILIKLLTFFIQLSSTFFVNFWSRFLTFITFLF